MNAAGPLPPGTPEGLVYVCDETPGIVRERRGKHFFYRRPDGSRITDESELERLRRLRIPPAYTSVWICPWPHGHLQATARDARGRKQYVYHPGWRLARDESKFDRLAEFGAALPRIRARVQRDLGSSALSRDSVLAAVVRLLDTTLVRIGNAEYARNNRSYGLTTLRKRHAELRGSALQLRFRGKSGVIHEISLADRRIARIVRRCQALPGQALFQYLDESGDLHSVGSGDVNEYLRTASGGDFTAKDFRTWHASVLALQLWRRARRSRQGLTRDGAKRLLEAVAQSLGNTVAVCRKSYVHPRVLTLVLPGEGGENIESVATSCLDAVRRRSGLNAGECALLALLEQ